MSLWIMLKLFIFWEITVREFLGVALNSSSKISLIDPRCLSGAYVVFGY